MESSPELYLFVIIFAVSVASAIGMLISQNAVHSALFLVLNFATIAFLYLMLDAAFLTMIQVSVYAGAIMVLFMFVIMLLGADRLTPEKKPRFSWFVPTAIGGSLVFLMIAGFVVLTSDIHVSEPEPHAPVLRVVNAAGNLESIDVYLNGEKIADGVAYHTISDFEEWDTGEFNVEVKPHNEAESVSLSRVMVEAESEEMTESETESEETTEAETSTYNCMLAGDDVVTLVVVQTDANSYGFIPVRENMDTVEHRYESRITLVNALPGSQAVDMVDITEPDRNPYVVAGNIAFGESVDLEPIRAGDYQYGVYEAERVSSTLDALKEDEKFPYGDIDAVASGEKATFEKNYHTLWILAAPSNVEIAGQPPSLLHFSRENRPSFGGPTSVGRSLFTTYMLPFQAIAILLLVAMIGAIVLTRDQVEPPRKQFPRRLANVPGNPVVEEEKG